MFRAPPNITRLRSQRRHCDAEHLMWRGWCGRSWVVLHIRLMVLAPLSTSTAVLAVFGGRDMDGACVCVGVVCGRARSVGQIPAPNGPNLSIPWVCPLPNRAVAPVLIGLYYQMERLSCLRCAIMGMLTEKQALTGSIKESSCRHVFFL